MTITSIAARDYLGVAIAITGNIFLEPMDGTPDADLAARERGDYPYRHLYTGDNAYKLVREMRRSQAYDLIDKQGVR